MQAEESKVTAPVMVTGATGYIASWVVHDLLVRGLTVHAAVRDPEDTGKVGHLLEMAGSLPGSLRLFKSDLLEAGSYGAAMEECAVVFHTASPFILNITDPQRQLIDPAVNGTRNVLQSVEATPSVRRVVLTSSCAAIYGDNADVSKTADGEFTEADWNTTSTLEHKPYSLSKTQAERAAWAMAETQERWSLVSINPSLVLGPSIQKLTTSGSFEIVRELGSGKLRWGVPDYGFGAVDVREVAEAHVTAGLDPAVPAGRFILSGYNTSLPELASILRQKYGSAYPFPRSILPKWLAWLFGPIVDRSITRRIISRNVGIPAAFNHTKSVRELGIQYRPLADSLCEMFEQVVEQGTIKAR